MKKIILPVVCLLLLTACADNKEKPGRKINDPAPTAETAAKDRETQQWLIGKEWKALEEAAPFSRLKVFSEDSCGFTTGRQRYSFRNGRLECFGAEWPLNKVSDTSFTIFVTPTQKTYSYTFVGNL